MAMGEQRQWTYSHGLASKMEAATSGGKVIDGGEEKGGGRLGRWADSHGLGAKMEAATSGGKVIDGGEEQDGGRLGRWAEGAGNLGQRRRERVAKASVGSMRLKARRR